MKKVLVLCTTDSMIWNFLIPHIEMLEKMGMTVECACTRTGFYLDELRDQYGLTVHEIGFTRNPVSFKNLRGFKTLCQLIREQEYDVIFCHEPVGGMMGRLAGKACRKKVVYMAHGFHFFSGAPFRHWLFYYTAEYILSFFTDALITINKEDYKRACKMHARRSYYVHGIGVQPQKLNSEILEEVLKQSLGISEDDLVLISVGELSERKNHRVILEAMQILADEKIRLILCGEGDLENDLKKMARRLGLTGQVIFTGFVKNIGDYYKIADICVFPSLWEGLGLAGLEAMAYGLPVLGSDRQGIRDYVKNGVTGYRFEPENAGQLAEKIRFLAERREKLPRFSEPARKMADRYSLEQSIKEMSGICQKEFA